jgi:hypothetical protein
MGADSFTAENAKDTWIQTAKDAKHTKRVDTNFTN